MISWSSILIISFFLIPFITQIRYFVLLRSTSYLYFSLIFLFAIFDEILDVLVNIFPATEGFIVGSLISVNFHFLLIFIIIISSEVKNTKIYPSTKFWILMGVLTLFITLMLKYMFLFGRGDTSFIYLRIVNGELYRLFTGIIVILSFTNTNLVINNNRTQRIRKMWIVVGFILLIAAISRILAFSVQLLLPSLIKFDLIRVHQIWGVITTGLIGLITFYLSFNYPETMLLSQFQINKADQLYNLVLKSEDQKNQIPVLDSMESLVDYINSLPSEMLDNLNKRK